jgi:hypothetical protein
MAELKHQFVVAGPTVSNISQANPAIGDVDIGHVRGLRYSSPWPWMLAGVISLAMWVSLACLIWVSIR